MPAIALITRRIPFVTILAHRLALENFFAEFEHAGFFRRGRRLSASWPVISREPEEARCGGNQGHATASALSCPFHDCTDHFEIPDMAAQAPAFHAQRQMSTEIIGPGVSVRTFKYELNPPNDAS